MSPETGFLIQHNNIFTFMNKISEQNHEQKAD